MKIIKETSGIIKLTEDNGDFITAIPGGQYIHLHPRDAEAVFVSHSADGEDYKNGITLKSSDVTEAFGTAFSGDRDALAILLSSNF